MDITGRRLQIVGSAATDADETKLDYIHSLVSELASRLATAGANFVLPLGKEPRLKDRTDGPSIILDWTVAEAVSKAINDSRALPSGSNGRLILTLATSKTDTQIPQDRRALYDGLRNTNAVAMEFLEPGWNSGAFRRQRLAQLGDVLIAISGGEGTEHLAVEYSSIGKSIIPLDINVGSSQGDGSGGAARLFDRALANPELFFDVSDPAAAADLLDRTRTRDCTTSPSNVVDALMNLIGALHQPQVFYVRLLDDKHADFAAVEAFFRSIVDPFVARLGYKSCQMGIGNNDYAWMNQAIFDSLHYSSVVLVDLTGLRPNCFMELGYALGNKQRVILTARDGTQLPFDSVALEACLWEPTATAAATLAKLQTHWDRNINMPPLVKPRKAK